jgi:hypothetical protein
MKELLSKRFWLDVKKTFHEALAEPPLKDNAPAAAEGQPKASSGADASSSLQRTADAVTRSTVQ